MRKSGKRLKTLLIYLVHREGIKEFYESHIKRLNRAGFDVEGFCITLNPPGPRLTFDELDSLWKEKSKDLMKVYADLKGKAEEKDVVVLYNGANLHPEFVEKLKTFNAYMCFDDPESSDSLSKPVAKYFDACFVGNIASLNQYYSWGCKNVFFRPLGYFESHLHLAKLNGEIIKNRANDIKVCLFCERESAWRKDRINYLEKEISDLYGRGKGWPKGWVSDREMLVIYGRSKIGLNLHNSTGPINLRTYTLPANGVMQICDNKYFLGHIFELGKEVIGYCDVREVPELVEYYLTHDEERKKIAVAGWKRALKDYNEIAVWQKQMEQIAALI